MTKKVLIPLVLVVFLAFVGFPLASGALVTKSGQSISVNETVDGNFFAAGNMVTIAGTVNGDVFAVGNNITISGTVNGDVFAAGSSIDISGNVNGNVRVVGSTISVRGTVERNLMAAGANLLISPTATIGRHLTFSGASLVLDAPVGGQIDAQAENISLNSSVGGDAAFELGGKGKLTLLSKASLEKDLFYRSLKEAEFKDGAQVFGETTYTPWVKAVKKAKVAGIFATSFLIGKLINLVSLFILGLIMILLVPKPMKQFNEFAKKNFWACLGLGLVFLIITPVIAVILMFTIIGIPLAFITLAVYGIALYFTKALAALAFGKLITDWLKWKIHLWVSLLVGLVVLSLIMLVPIIGWLVGFVIFLWALGAWMKLKKEILKEFK